MQVARQGIAFNNLPIVTVNANFCGYPNGTVLIFNNGEYALTAESFRIAQMSDVKHFVGQFGFAGYSSQPQCAYQRVFNNRPIALYQSVLESICDPIKGLFVWMHFQKLKIAKKA